MNKIYKLIFNLSTGTWSVASELTASRGKKSRLRLAGTMAMAMALPSGAALAADSPLQCGINESLSADGKRCEGGLEGSTLSGGIGTMATAGELERYISIGAVAAGMGADASTGGELSTALGRASHAATYGTAVGAGARSGPNAVAVGTWVGATGNQSVGMGIAAKTPGFSAIAVGAYSHADVDSAVALGASSAATAAGSVALGSESIASAPRTVSIGTTTLKRRLVNMAAGSAGTDAVNVDQLKPLIKGLGGGATIDAATGTVTGPEFKLNGSSYSTVGDALHDLDTRTVTNADGLADLDRKLVGSGLLDPGGEMNAMVTYDRNADGTANRGSVTFGNGSGATQLKNVAAGSDGNDAVNLDQLNTAIADAVPAPNPYIAGRGAGAAAQATAQSSVALGINSVADALNTVSVGNTSTGLVRRITNVADGSARTDAATLGQVNDLVTNVRTSSEQSISDVNAKIDALGARGAADAAGTSGAKSVKGTKAATGAAGTLAALDDTFIKVDSEGGSPAAVVGPGTSAIAIGTGASATGSFSAALGADSEATGTQAVAIGGDAKATADGALAMGTATATRGNATALGNGASATADNAVAAGFNARATGLNAVAMGNTASAAATNAIVVGTSASVDAAATNGIALGRGAAVTAAGAGSIALGSNATADRANVVSVGSAAQRRQIINLADGTADNDAVNLGQMKDYVANNGGSIADPLMVAYASDDKGDIALAGADGTTISNVKAGTVAADSNEAINGAQLHASSTSVADALGGGAVVNADGTVSAPSYSIGGEAKDSVGDAFQALDGAVTGLDGRVDAAESSIGTITTNVTNLGDQITSLTNGTTGIVTFDATAGTVNVAAGQGGTQINLANATGQARTLNGVAAGTVAADSDQAINGAQLHGTAGSVASAIGGGASVAADGTVTAPTFSLDDGAGNATDFSSVGEALGNLDSRSTANRKAIGTVADQLVGSGLVDAEGNVQAAVKYDKRVDGTPDYGSVTLGNGTGAVRMQNVAAGTADTDAVNVGQLAAATVNPYISGRGAGTAAVATSLSAVALGTNSIADQLNTISVGNAATGLVRRVTNVANGQADTDAATVGQVNALVGGVTRSTGEALSEFDQRISSMIDSSTLGTVDDQFLKIDGAPGDDAASVTAGTSSIAMGTGAKGEGSFSVALGAASEATGVQSTAIGAEAKATQAGALAMGSAQATGAHAAALGDGAVASAENAVALGFNANATGTNALALGNTSHAFATNAIAIGAASSVDAAATNGLALGRGATVGAAGIGSVALGEGSVVARANSVSVGSDSRQRQIINLAQGSADTDAVNVGQLKAYVADNAGGGPDPLAVAYAAADKGDIALAGSDGTTISNVKAGTVAADSSEAINGTQLHGTAASIAAGLGGGAVVNADGSVSAPHYSIDGSDYGSVGDALGAVDTSLTGLGDRVTVNEGNVSNLSEVVNNLSSGAAGLVTRDASSGAIAIGGALGGDVINVGGTAGERRISGLANGIEDADAATLGQLKASGLVDPNTGRALGALVYDDLSLGRATLGGTDGTVLANLGNGLIASGSREAVTGGQVWQLNADWDAKWSALDGRVGTIEHGIADGSIGGGSGGTGPTDPGAGIVNPGTGEGSVAIGSGSVAAGDREVSVGAPGAERRITNVAAGTAPTDAVNKQQMDDRFSSERDYTDSRLHAVDKRIDRMGAISAAYAGMAINTAGLAGDNRVGAGIGSQNGRSALAVGYQRILGEQKNISVSLGGAFSGSDQSVSAGAGFSW